jgi:hypothetical protein
MYLSLAFPDWMFTFAESKIYPFLAAKIYAPIFIKIISLEKF